MPRKPRPWLYTARGTWHVTVKGKLYNLGRDKEAAMERFERLKEETDTCFYCGK